MKRKHDSSGCRAFRLHRKSFFDKEGQPGGGKECLEPGARSLELFSGSGFAAFYKIVAELCMAFTVASRHFIPKAPVRLRKATPELLTTHC